MSNDQEVEKEIIKKGLTAPRITPEMIENTIVHEDYHVFPGTMTTICSLTLLNGFSTNGSSACVSPENFNEELGRKIARDNAVQEIWVLEGYLLKQKLYEASKATWTNGPVYGLG